jgi:hypothetical protein
MSATADKNIGASLTSAQRDALSKIVEKLRKEPTGDLTQSSVRIKTLWRLYLTLIHAEAEAAVDPKKVIKKGSTATERKGAIRTLKNHLGRPPTAEDLAASLGRSASVDAALLKVIRRDLEQLQQRAARRTRGEIIAEKINKLQKRLDRPTKSGSSKKGGKK